MSDNRGHGGAKWCGVEHLIMPLEEKDVTLLKLLLWNWARMLAEDNPIWIKDPMVVRELFKPMLNVMQKGIEGRLYQ